MFYLSQIKECGGYVRITMNGIFECIIELMEVIAHTAREKGYGRDIQIEIKTLGVEYEL